MTSTSRPGSRKAHDTASESATGCIQEPRSAGLVQTAHARGANPSVAVLEQPSPSRMRGHALGRRNIALLETSELEAAETSENITGQPRPRKRPLAILVGPR